MTPCSFPWSLVVFFRSEIGGPHEGLLTKKGKVGFLNTPCGSGVPIQKWCFVAKSCDVGAVNVKLSWSRVAGFTHVKPPGLKLGEEKQSGHQDRCLAPWMLCILKHRSGANPYCETLYGV